MNFISITYALFLFSVLGIYWTVQQQSWRLWAILAASVVFYSALQVQYVPLLFAGTLVNFRLGQAIALSPDWRNDNWPAAEQQWQRQRRWLLWLGISLNVLLLVGFKYLSFLLATAAAWFGWAWAVPTAQWTTENLIVPLGLSFFCFECIAYLIDVYRGAPAAQSFLKFSAYKLFFPKLLSGPITRYHAMAGQMQGQSMPAIDRLADGLWLIASGAIKKGLLADNLGIVVEPILQNLERAGSGDLWLALFAYGFQLYLDFSGYVDMARGTAILLGFNLPVNFDFPYLATSIADFWRRWHMTLGDWLRNYLYFPLGGSRKGLARTCLNLISVMAIAGLWHGAAWGFVVWGLWHGVALVINRLNDALAARTPPLKRFWQSTQGVAAAWLLTQLAVFLGWIFFRLPNLQDSWLMVQRLVGHSADAQFAPKVYGEAIGLQPLQITLLLLLLFGLMGLAHTLQQGLRLQLNWTVKLMLVPACLFAVWLLAPQGGAPFLYFDF